MNLWPVEHFFQHICHHFWVGLLGAIANPPKSDDKYVEKVFNWSKVHLSKTTCYKIHTLLFLGYRGSPPYVDFGTWKNFCVHNRGSGIRGSKNCFVKVSTLFYRDSWQFLVKTSDSAVSRRQVATVVQVHTTIVVVQEGKRRCSVCSTVHTGAQLGQMAKSCQKLGSKNQWNKTGNGSYRAYDIEMDKTKWLWGVEESIILLNCGA